MIDGLDTGSLVAAEVVEHADHAAARETLAQLMSGGESLALASQVLADRTRPPLPYPPAPSRL